MTIVGEVVLGIDLMCSQTTEVLVKTEAVSNTSEMDRDDFEPAVGQWYWVTYDDGPLFGCVQHVGSNYVHISHPNNRFKRIHINEFSGMTAFEGNPDAVLDGEVARCEGNVRRLMGLVTGLTERLSVTPRTQLGEAPPETMALSKISMDLGAYKTALVRAKEKQLPDLFKGIKEANEEMAMWMTAKLIPLKAMADGMRGTILQVEGRIFSIELYAGLTETVGQFAEGEPAPADAKLHLMQRRCYMDEECLARYETGGMEFANLREFDAWLARPENRDRILPFLRCMVSFRVRRHHKERHGNSLSEWIQIACDREADTSTFLYIRNGENLYWMQSKLDFGPKLFPDHEHSALSGGELMFKVHCDSVGGFITRGAYDQMVQDEEDAVAADKIKKAAFEVENEAREARGERPQMYWGRSSSSFRYDRYEAFSPDSVFYDDMRAKVAKEITQYNRIALIVQGLFDRSPVFHPHAPVKTWSQEGFEEAIKLVFDDDRALYADEKPDFQAYFDRLNRLLKPGDVTIGQELFWMKREAKRENKKYRPYRDRRTCETYRPYGNPGPGYIVVPTKLTRKFATYRWTRERLIHDPWKDDLIPVSIRVPREKLFNVSAYKPGDFRQFFADPRTRDEYIKWAPLLLAAEDYHANTKRGECHE